MYDAASALSYLNARYYDGDKGRFLSQDPTFLAVGNGGQLKQITGQDLQTVLADPQQLNSYSYGKNNPITLKDPDGNFVPVAIAVLTAPEWLPVTIAALGVAAASTAVLLRNNGLRYIPDGIRGVQMPRPPSLFPDPGSGPEKTPANKWLRWGVGGISTLELAKWLYSNYQNITSKGPDNQNSDTQVQSQQFIGPQSTQSTPALVGSSNTCGASGSWCSPPQQTQQIKPANTIDKPR